MPGALQQKIAGVGTGFGIAAQKPADDALGLVGVRRGGEPRIEFGALLGQRFRLGFVPFRLRRGTVRIGLGRARQISRPRRRAGRKDRGREAGEKEMRESPHGRVYRAKARPKKGPGRQAAIPAAP